MLKKLLVIFACNLLPVACYIGAAHAASDGVEFQAAAQLLNAARNGNIPMVERLVNSGANVNYVDGTGLSIVCTAIMNNDLKAAQILQVYGADASGCDQQIRRYRNKLPKENSGGLFSGLSNTQNLTLAAGGAALVIGGLYLAGDGLFGGGENGGGGLNGGDRPNTGNGGNNGGGSGSVTGKVAIGYGPAQCTWVNGVCTPILNDTFNLTGAMNVWSSGTGNTNDWNHMKSNLVIQNYMILNGGYATLGRGYTGQITYRNPSTGTPLAFKNTSAPGMTPIPVALITANGILNPGLGGGANLAGTAGAKQIGYATLDNAANVQSTNRYKNVNMVADPGDPTGETMMFLEQNADDYDYSVADGSTSSTVFDTNRNSWLNEFSDTMLAKILVGETYEGNTGDFIGFMPNGQLAVYRTGGGKLYDNNLGAAAYDATTLTIGGTTYAKDTDYIVKSDGHFYMNDGTEYAVRNGDLWEMTQQDYMNFDAMLRAWTTGQVGFSVNGINNKGGIIANASLNSNMKHAGVEEAGRYTSTNFYNLIDYYYYHGDGNSATNTAPLQFFTNVAASAVSNKNTPFVIWSAGEYEIGPGKGTLANPEHATFENSAPLVHTNMNHFFMTAVAVQITGGTGSVSSAAGEPTFGSSRMYTLANYTNADDETYGARSCGIAGTVESGGTVDPWCFSVGALTGEQAVATLAGAAGILQSAFHYTAMTNEYIFALLALTADGKRLGIDTLRTMYKLPADWDSSTLTNDEWKKKFDEAFGYGMINLKYASEPGHELFFYGTNSSKINSTAGNAYWRTAFNPGKVFSAKAANISAPMFDFVESADGTESMPRVFDMALSFGGEKYGLTLSEALDGISFGENKNENLTFELTGNGTEIKNMKIKLNGVSVGYRERASTKNNPILGLAGNAMTTDWTFGAFGFSIMNGKITDETLLNSDPALTNQFTPAALGNVYGFDSGVKLGALKFGIGYMDEDTTTLGAYSGGLFDMGGGKTIYGGAELRLGAFTAKYTAARTQTDPGFGFIEDISDLYSDAYSLSADFGKWSFSLSRPLAITRGSLEYMRTDYEIVESANGYDLITTPYAEKLNLAPETRETRLAVFYQPEISERTKLGFGLMERVNPNNMPGHEEILMMKFRHIW